MDLSVIQSKIRMIRGYKVMLDFDIAETYGIETKYLKRAVRSNIKRFEGEDFMFELTKEEFTSLRSQIVISNQSEVGEFEVQKMHLKQRGGIRYMPFAFTELGVAMLSSVLNSETAIDTNRKIMRAFVAVRHLIIDSQPVSEVKEVRQLKQYIEEAFTDYNDINEDTRAELESINEKLSVTNMQFSEIYQALIGLADKKGDLDNPRKPMGFIQSNNETK